MIDYIVLATQGAASTASEPSVPVSSHRFRVPFAERSYNPMRSKASSLKRTVTGKIDHQVGPVNLEWRYMLMVAGTTDPAGSDYGTLSDLKTLYDLNDPDGRPPNTLDLTDHYETEHEVYFVDILEEQPYSPNLSGSCAWFRVPVHLVKTSAE
jgi:hypothetical protein